MSDTPEDGKELSEGVVNSLNLQYAQWAIKRTVQDHRFRQVSFYGAVSVAVVLFLALICYIFFGSTETPTPERIGIAAILAAVPTLILLALIRKTLLSSREDQEESEDMSIWQSLARELIGVLKDYVSKK